MLFIYLPILVASPLDLVALNYFFDTLLFSGAVLALADALRQRTAAGQLTPELAVLILSLRAIEVEGSWRIVVL